MRSNNQHHHPSSGSISTTKLDSSSSSSSSSSSRSYDSLLEILQSDIFSKSSTTNNESSNYHDQSTTTNHLHQQHQRPLSNAELKYNDILDQSEALLVALSPDVTDASTTGNGSSNTSTLQLMDFDKVMTQWSRFGDPMETSDFHHFLPTSQSNEKTAMVSLKQNASNRCMELLEALERNYDCIFENETLLSFSSSSSIIGIIKELPPTKHPQLMPNAASYNIALHTLAHSGKGSAVAQEACTILNRMLDRCRMYMDALDSSSKDRQHVEGVTNKRKLPPPPPEPTIITYNSVIHAISKSGARDAGHLAEEVFGIMEQWKNECDARTKDDKKGERGTVGVTQHVYHGVLPNARTLACVIDAWAHVKDDGQQSSFAPERTEAILELAVKKRRAYVDYVKGVAYGHGDDDDILDIFSKEVDTTARDGIEENLTLADFDGVEEEVLEDYPNTDHAEEEELPLSEEYTLPSPSLSETVAPFLRPNIVAFNTCLNVWATSRRGREGALRTYEILNQMEALSQSGELDLPDNFSTEPSKDMLDIDDDDSSEIDSSLRPNTRSYSTVMNAWAKVSRNERGSGEDAATQCEAILRRMEERGAEDASIRPNLMAYTTCITAWARTRNVEYAASRAEDILNRMIDLCYSESDRVPSLEGNRETAGNHDAPFNAVITAYARSPDPHAAERAVAVLDRLESSTISPTLTTYNAGECLNLFV